MDVDSIVEAWLQRLGAVPGGPRPVALLDGYRELGRALVRDALESDSSGASDVDRLVGALAATSRSTGVAMALVVADVGALAPAATTSMCKEPPASEDGFALLARADRLVSAAQSATARLAHLLEASAARARREKAAALASVSDVVAHELGNRLGAAKTASRMLLGAGVGLDEQVTRRAAELVQSSVEAALRTLDDVRALMLSMGEEAESSPRTMPLGHLVRTVLEEVRGGATTAGVVVGVDGRDADVLVDAARCRLILFNLVWNGIKYRGPAAEEPTVEVDYRLRPEGDVQLEVRDNGVGIPAGDLEDVFGYRVRGEESGDVPGSGLGLAIVSEAVAQLGGRISVRSEPGSGSTFTVTFAPVEVAPPKEDRSGG